MKVIVCNRYGPPEVLKIQDFQKPVPQDNEILVKVRATSVTVADVRTRAFRVPPMYWIPGRLALGIRGPRIPILGHEQAGDVEAVGKDVTRFKVGDAVLGHRAHAAGAYAEYCCLLDDGDVVIKPTCLSYEEAAVIPVGGLTALNFLRSADIQPGQTVLVNGASGSLGTYAVQLARRHFGAHVTGVCSGANADLVRSLGADEVIDYTREDFSRSGRTYDVVFDAVGNTTFAQCKRLLEPSGVYLHSVMVMAELKTPWYGRRTGIKVVGGSPLGHPDALKDLVRLVESGVIKPIIDRCYPLEQIVDAHRYVDTGRKKGNVAITITQDLA